ncbi:arginine--tRNA ligase [Candidatus Woesearchaeota archaeon]|nr:arginine--tRNA ligase [Candidatus Woesearchaeota archaeon]
MNFFKQHITNLLIKIIKNTNLQKNDIIKLLEVPPDKDLGDFSFPCFELAKRYKKSPTQISEELKNKIPKSKLIKKIEIKNGYINFFIEEKELISYTLNNIQKNKQKYGSSNTGKKRLVMIEYSSPNTNKPLHLGHVRNNVLGMSLSNLYEFSGYRIIKTSLVNDRGIHICKSMLAYMKYGKNKIPDKKPDHFVGDFYALFTLMSKENPGLELEAQELLKKWESKDKKTLALWKKMNSWVYKGFEETYKIIGSRFDKTYYESKIYEKAKEIVSNGLKKGIFKKENDTITANLSRFNLPNKILMRSDKTSLYITQDIYLAILKFKQYKLFKSIYVVANEQNLHFKQLFTILNMLGYKWYNDCYHLSYGYVLLPSGKMKSREGTVIDADNLIAEMKSMAKNELLKRYKLSAKELERRSVLIALAAIKFFFLKYETFKDIVFNPEESISFEGETGPYIQYTYARANSILKKSKNKTQKYKPELLNKKEEIDIIDTLSKFPDTVEEAVLNYKPSLIAHYLINLCQQFNEFYQKHPVLKAEKQLRNARLLLVIATKQTILNASELLNIDLLEKM